MGRSREYEEYETSDQCSTSSSSMEGNNKRPMKMLKFDTSNSNTNIFPDLDDTKDDDLTGLSPLLAFSVLQRRQSQQIEKIQKYMEKSKKISAYSIAVSSHLKVLEEIQDKQLYYLKIVQEEINSKKS